MLVSLVLSLKKSLTLQTTYSAHNIHMKDKNIAGLLALILGPLGIHRFYLGQPGLGIAYLIFCWMPVVWLIAFIDAILFFVMEQDVFDFKYNRQFVDKREYRRNVGQERRQRTQHREPQRRTTSRTKQSRKPDPYLKTGIEKYKDFDFKGAIADFKKSLGVRPKSIKTHFYLACAYSMTEQADEGFFHLDKAVEFGFTEIEKIKTMDALAFLRIQPEYDTFKANGFRLMAKNVAAPEADREMDDLLLVKLKRLGELRDRGFISEEEFIKEKAKLLRDS